MPFHHKGLTDNQICIKVNGKCSMVNRTAFHIYELMYRNQKNLFTLCPGPSVDKKKTDESCFAYCNKMIMLLFFFFSFQRFGGSCHSFYLFLFLFFFISRFYYNKDTVYSSISIHQVSLNSVQLSWQCAGLLDGRPEFESRLGTPGRFFPLSNKQ